MAKYLLKLTFKHSFDPVTLNPSLLPHSFYRYLDLTSFGTSCLSNYLTGLLVLLKTQTYTISFGTHTILLWLEALNQPKQTQEVTRKGKI